MTKTFSAIALLFGSLLLNSPAARGHVFDKTSIDFTGVRQTNTFTITDRSGCTATTRITIQDPTLISVDPLQTGFVATFTYTVVALKPGKTTITIHWVGNEAAGCFDSGTQLITVTVAEPSTTPEQRAALNGITLDIHPIQVVQTPPFEDVSETIPLIAEKSTMIRVFLIWSPPDPTVLPGVICHINADGVADMVTADVYYVGGKTYVLPVGSEANPIGGGYSNVSRSRNGQEAFNFDFPRTLGHHPGGSQSTIQARLEFNGTTYAPKTEQFGLRPAAKTIHISFRTIESLNKPLAKNAAALAGVARSQFDRIVAVYPVPHSRARMYFTAEPTRIAGTLGAFSTWLLEASLNTPGSEYIDLYVMIASGKIQARGNQPGRAGMIEDWAGQGTYGYAPWYLSRTVYMAEDAEPFTTAHEYGHKLIGMGHSSDSADNGWDVRRYTSRSTPYKPQGTAASESGNFQALMWSTANSDGEGWITAGEYTTLMESLAASASAGRSLPARRASPGSTHILISGEFTSAAAVTINPFFLTPTPPTQLPPGPFAARCLAADGSVVSQKTFGLEPPPPPSKPFINPSLPVTDVQNNCFLFSMEFPKNTARIQIVRQQDQTVLAERRISPNPPSLTIDGLRQIDNSYEVTLSAADPDGDPLQYVVSYSPDGLEQIPLNVEWMEPNRRFRFAGRGLPGSAQGRIRVLATDGALSADAYSPGAVFPNQKPLVSILEPLADSTFSTNTPISLRGVAYDPEDGILSALQWRLDNNPDVIGTNEWLVLPSASMGDHFLTLRATDAAGNSDETQIRITIAPVERLSFTRQTDSGAIILHWTSSSTLQSAPQITGPWADVPGAGNPYPVPFDSPLQFYRLQLRP